MTIATDTFDAFLHVLAEALDEHDLDGADLADRVHLSRHHLDRVVRATSGEPPRALRRRILLERAAYRLATTNRTVLDVAVEAGYSSHEAFTRAFSRAFGRPPTQWRRSPRTIRVEGTSGIHFQPPGTIRVPAQRKVTPMDLLTRMVEHHIWLTGEMIEQASHLDDDVLDRRIEISVDDDPQSIRSLLSRLVGQMGMWNAAVAGRDYDWSVENGESTTSLRNRLAAEGPVFLGHVRTVVDEGRLDDTFVDALCEPAEVFTYGGMIAHVLTFAAHRRTLVALALIEAGVPGLGWGDPMAWVAEGTAP